MKKLKERIARYRSAVLGLAFLLGMLGVLRFLEASYLMHVVLVSGADFTSRMQPLVDKMSADATINKDRWIQFTKGMLDVHANYLTTLKVIWFIFAEAGTAALLSLGLWRFAALGAPSKPCESDSAKA